MEPSFWHERWERSEIGFHQQDINVHLQQFWTQLDLRPGQRVFAPLCGKSRDLLWLAGEGHPVTGVEISQLAVEAFFTENGLKPRRWREGAFEIWEVDEIRILLGDFFDLEPQHLADAAGIYDRASLIALPPPMRALRPPSRCDPAGRDAGAAGDPGVRSECIGGTAVRGR